LARLNHADNARVITTEILRQNPEKIAETSSGEVSTLNFSGFHTVCKKNAQRLKHYPYSSFGKNSPHETSSFLEPRDAFHIGI
jgi:hypothetical protein